MSRRIRKIAILLIMSMFVILIAGCGSKNSISADSFYYNQLTEIEKGIYRNIEARKNEFMEGKKVECLRADSLDEIYIIINEDMYSRAFMAYCMDVPLSTLWCNISFFDFTVEQDETTQQFIFYLIPKEENKTIYSFETSEELIAAIKEIEKTSKEFVNTLEGTNHEKIRAIHDWMINGAVYNANKHDQNIYGSLVKKEATCYGFACGFKYLCDIAGVNAINVVGEDQAWNYVQDDDGRWYLVDVTWDIEAETKYFLNEIIPRMASGERENSEYYHFSYDFFYLQ